MGRPPTFDDTEPDPPPPPPFQGGEKNRVRIERQYAFHYRLITSRITKCDANRVTPGNCDMVSR